MFVIILIYVILSVLVSYILSINGEAKRADAIVKVVKEVGELCKIEIQKKKMELEYGAED